MLEMILPYATAGVGILVAIILLIFIGKVKQCGYVRYNDHILMEDITDEEYEALADFLDELREEKKSCVSQ